MTNALKTKTPIQRLIDRCKSEAVILGTAEMEQQAIRAQAEYDAIVTELNERKRECCTRFTAGATLVAEERLRQIRMEVAPEPSNNLRCEAGDMAQAGAALVTHAVQQIRKHGLPAGVLWGRALFPWSWEYWNPADDVRTNLVRGAARIVGEIDKLLEGSTKNG